MGKTVEQVRKGSLKALAECAVKMTGAAVNSACFFYMYQEELPEEAKKLRKF